MLMTKMGRMIVSDACRIGESKQGCSAVLWATRLASATCEKEANSEAAGGEASRFGTSQRAQCPRRREYFSQTSA